MGNNMKVEGLARPIIDADLLADIERSRLVVSGNGTVTWAEGNSQHPRNWKLGRKLYDTGMIMVVELFT
jgi:hypothetical protein